jgi:hypothetical protein
MIVYYQVFFSQGVKSLSQRFDDLADASAFADKVHGTIRMRRRKPWVQWV